jgi:CubicO group peptidase (beta-lactamase class C family)
MVQLRHTVLCILLIGFTVVRAQDATFPDYWPTDDWRTSTPAEQGMDGDLLANIGTTIEDEDMTFVRALLVVRHGYLVFEEYYNGFEADDRDNVRSITKSVTSALVGIALANGDIESLDVTVADFFPEYVADDDQGAITLRDLLMMRSGLKWGEANWQVIPLWESDLDQMGRILSLPLEYPPGEHWNYSTADAHLIGGILTRAAGVSLLDYADAHLFEPLGIVGAEWDTDSQGYNVGGSGLSLTPGEMAKFGYLYLNGGLWDGEQIVPADWVALTTTAQDEETDYGYLWWRGEREFFSGYPAFAALGYGGDMVFVYPALDLLVVAKTSYFVTATAAGQQEDAVMGLIREYVIPAVDNGEQQSSSGSKPATDNRSVG